MKQKMNTLNFLKKNIPFIEKKIGYEFSNKDLLIFAFTHPSFLNEKKSVKEDNERLEFLGDSVLSILVSEYLFKRFPKKKEGKLSFMRSNLIDWSRCSFFFKKMKLEKYILLGRGEFLEKRGKESVFANLFEAIIGAIYLDGGISFCRKFLENFYEDIENILKNPPRNYKQELQIYFQKKYKKLPSYKMVKEKGPDHLKTFEVDVIFSGKIFGKGFGKSKSEAEQNAAKDALKKI